MVLRELGGPEALIREELESPRPGRGELRVAVRAIGCNFADTLITRGKYQVRPELPFAPGLEGVGEVVEIGEEVRDFAVGDRVLAVVPYGAFASELVTSEARAFRLPASASDEDGVALGVAYQTSMVALSSRARLEAGETLLVHAAAGGVGLAAVQIGKAMGATVIGTAGGAEKLELVRAAGADHTLDYRDDAWVDRVKELTGGRGADVIYDPVGGETFDLSTKCIAFSGRILVVGFAGGTIPTLAMNRVLLKNFAVVGVHWGAYFENEPETLKRDAKVLFALYDRGLIKPLIAKRFPLEQAREALEALADRKTVGKVVLIP
jgi:NADPH:quinone reductase